MTKSERNQVSEIVDAVEDAAEKVADGITDSIPLFDVSDVQLRRLFAAAGEQVGDAIAAELGMGENIDWLTDARLEMVVKAFAVGVKRAVR